MYTDCSQLHLLKYPQFQLWLERWTFLYKIQIDIQKECQVSQNRK